MRHAAEVLLVLALAAASVGCHGGAGSLQVRYFNDQDTQNASLAEGFDHAFYRHVDDNTLTVLLLKGTAEQPQQAVVIRVLWEPRAGRTAVAESATNATISYAVFQGEGSVGLYAGAGFVQFGQRPGAPRWAGSVGRSSLRLAGYGAGFDRDLVRAVVKGGFNAQRDDRRVAHLIEELNRQIHSRLGYPRLVRAD